MTDEQKVMFVPTEAEIMTSVQSLCVDQLKPFGRVILKRLREHAAASEAASRGLPAEAVDPESTARIDPKQLRKLCEECSGLQVAPEEGKEYSAVPSGQSLHFIEVCDPADLYDSKLWSGLTRYFGSMVSSESTLPCGRYACARALMSQQLDCLVGLSFGKICHVVQLAISQKKLLGHRDGRLVPYETSDECAKERCAQRQQPFSAKKTESSDALPVATWESTRACLQQLLLTADSKDLEPGTLPLSDVKRLFRRQFELELNETALGYTRVFDLLQDSRLRDICTVHSQGNGQVSVRRVEPQLRWPAPASGARLASVPGRVEAGERIPQFSPVPAVRPQMCLSTVPTLPLLHVSPIAAPECIVRPMFPRLCLSVDLSEQELVSPGASPRGQIDCGYFWQSACQCDENDVASTTADGTNSTCDEDEEETPSFCMHFVKNTFIDITPESAAFGSARRRTQSEPRSMRCLRGRQAQTPSFNLGSPTGSRTSWAEMSEESDEEAEF